jgi:hypothetical protein
MWSHGFFVVLSFLRHAVMAVDVVIHNHCDFEIYAWNVVQGEQRTTTNPDWTIYSGETHRSPPVHPDVGNPAIKLNIDPYLVDPNSK